MWNETRILIKQVSIGPVMACILETQLFINGLLEKLKIYKIIESKLRFISYNPIILLTS